MNTSIMLFTRDLRVHDNPALTAALAADRVVPVFVWDEAILSGSFAVPNRLRFLADSVADLRASLRDRGGDLVIRRGDPAREVGRLAEETGATSLHLADDRSHFARRRLAALRDLPLAVHPAPGVTVVPPGDLTPVSGDHYKVFTPYWRAWSGVKWRDVLGAPRKVTLPSGLAVGREFTPEGKPSPAVLKGGETEARRRLKEWLAGGAARYDDERDTLAHDATSRLSAALRFGCVSPLEVAERAKEHDGFVRQLAWRDFHYQVAAAFPDLARRDYRPRAGGWNHGRDALDAWLEGRTGYPIVDAGMRQLVHEGFMHNRARMITASFLTKTLGFDWRHGYAHFNAWLTDGDVANNAGNWQWTAGTGNDTRPNRVLSPLRQASRFDADGAYVRAWVPELADVDAAYVHEPWKLAEGLRRKLGYPAPVLAPEELKSAGRR